MLAVALAFAASLSWGVADFTGGLKSRTLPIALVLLIIESVGLVLVTTWIVATAEPLPGFGTALLALAAGSAGTAGLFAFYRALAVGTMSVVAPISACGVALPVLVGLLGGDHVSLLTAIGMAVAVVGVVLAAREGPTEDDHARPAARSSIALALVAALGFGSYFTLSDPVADESIPWLLFAARILICPLLLVWLLRNRPPAPHRVDAGVLVVAGTLDVSATALYGLALREGALSVVSVVGSLYPVVTVLLARAVLGERLRGLQAAGAVGALAGIALIATGR